VDTGSTSTLSPNFGTPGARTVEVRAVKSDGSFGYASLTLAPTEPVPALDVKGERVIGGSITLDGSGTSDPDGLVKDYLWDLDSNASFETDTGLTNVAATSYASSGSKRAGIEVDYGFGWAQTFVSFDIAGPSSSLPGPSLPGTTPVTPSGPVPPSLSARNIRLAKLLKSGLPLLIKCNGPCLVQFTLSVDAKTARRLHLKRGATKPVTIGRVRGQFIAGTIKPVLRL
jgi:hypothetical protein